MIEKRIENIEDMLSQLIGMVGSIQVEQQTMKNEQQSTKQDLQEMKIEQQSTKQDLQEMKIEQQSTKQDLQDVKSGQQTIKQKLEQLEKKAEERHREVLARFKDLEMDQDFIWEKAARNEREIEFIKRKLG